MPPASTQLAITEAAIKAELAAGAIIYPSDPWRALRLVQYDEVKVVILGQDPYHGPGQAQGLAFSVASDCKTPPSLKNIFAEIAQDHLLANDGLKPQPDPDLTRWAKQGVLLLNTSLTVRDGLAASHAKLGWQIVTDAVIAAVAKRQKPTVFMLWGAHAQAKTTSFKRMAGNISFCRPITHHRCLHADHQCRFWDVGISGGPMNGWGSRGYR